jgi:hypothetical protein
MKNVHRLATKRAWVGLTNRRASLGRVRVRETRARVRFTGAQTWADLVRMSLALLHRNVGRSRRKEATDYGVDR